MSSYQTDHLDASAVELVLHLGESTEFSGADGGEVGGVREEDGPAVADPLVEVDFSLAIHQPFFLHWPPMMSRSSHEWSWP